MVIWKNIVEYHYKGKENCITFAKVIHLKKTNREVLMSSKFMKGHIKDSVQKASIKYKQFYSKNSSSDICQDMQLIQL